MLRWTFPILVGVFALFGFLAAATAFWLWASARSDSEFNAAQSQRLRLRAASLLTCVAYAMRGSQRDFCGRHPECCPGAHGATP